MAKEFMFFYPKDRGAITTKALWVTLAYHNKRCSLQRLGRTS